MTTSNRCVRCDCPIDGSNDSEEHVIQNSVGGRLKVRGFICRGCNNRTGETWDAVFAEQTNFFCHFFGVVRERGEPPPQPIVTTAGEQLLMQPGGGFKMQNPVFKEIPTEGGKQVQIKARDRREATTMLEGLARKYPKVDVAAEMAKATADHTYPEGVMRLDIHFGGPSAGRSVVKTATAFAFHCGVPIEQCDLAVAYLRDEVAEPAFGDYFERDLVTGRPVGVPIHCVAVTGDPETGMLLGYVEFFGVQRVVVCLSQSYAGPLLARAYGLDPTTGKMMPLQVELAFSATDVKAIYNYERVPDGSRERAFDAVVPTAMKRNFDRAIAHESARATQYAFENCGAKPGDKITPELAKKIAELATERMMPFIQRHARRR
ncbi:HNH endonuclease [Bradyrhizobium sp.]|uniref:HNH endonuclease n=1 Tax=Bradyrhizobium sp. TaxID=376 RepID=UPI0025C18AE3|nr:HNH endonuclease [Bradyrhizobium sp.]